MGTSAGMGKGKGDDGYEALSGNGPRVRTDVVDVYVFREATEAEERAGASGEDWSSAGTQRRRRVMFLQLLRSGEPLMGTWHPVMGHVESGESAAECAKREMREEIGLDACDEACLGVWALEQVHPFFISAIDTIVMSPRFAAKVKVGWTARLNGEHSAQRWVHEDDVEASFMWPGQVATIREILSVIVSDRSLARERLAIAR